MPQIPVPADDLESWISELKPYQKSTLQHFTATMDAEAAAERWLTTIGSPNIVGFGGGAGSDPKPYLVRFKTEFRKYICDESAYAEDKKELLAHSQLSKALLISTMSGAIGSTMGTAGTLLAPAVTLLLFTVGKMGLNAYCST